MAVHWLTIRGRPGTSALGLVPVGTLPPGEAREGGVASALDVVDDKDARPDQLRRQVGHVDAGLVGEGLTVDAEGEPPEAPLPVGLCPEGQEQEASVGGTPAEGLVKEDLGI